MVSQRKTDLKNLAIFIAIIVLVNIVSSNVFTRVDFTTEKRYTLSPITKDILERLNENIQVTVYLEGADFPAPFKRLRSSTFDILTDLKAYSNNRLIFDFVNPVVGNEQFQRETFQKLFEKGIEPTNVTVDNEAGRSQKVIFPFALITYKGLQIPVKLLQTRSGASYEEVINNSIQNLEYA
ncbi:MAG: DUF7088 domain-containing protein, partial [Daejeonella sp.]